MFFIMVRNAIGMLALLVTRAPGFVGAFLHRASLLPRFQPSTSGVSSGPSPALSWGTMQSSAAFSGAMKRRPTPAALF